MGAAAIADLSRIRFALHGGAGNLVEDRSDQSPVDDESCAALRHIAEEAMGSLRDGANSLDVVTQAVTRLENCPLFNAGVGAVLNRDGVAELDAAVMRGTDRAGGAVAGISRVRNPVQLARAVMERTPHVLFCGRGAERLAQDFGLAMVEPGYFITEQRLRQLEQARRAGTVSLDHDALPDAVGERTAGDGFGTVGAVARDARGELAAATSTGGLTNKLPGRVGDSALLGIGTFADDVSCAVSATGTGEAFIRAGFALAVQARIVLSRWNLAEACAEALTRVRSYGGHGGCIAISCDGDIALPFNSTAMYRAWGLAEGPVRVAIRADETI